jgi:hypothetical protein
MPGTVLALDQDAEESQTEKQEAQREHQGAHDAPPRVEGRAISPDDAHPQGCHAEGPAARRPGVSEIEELPGSEDDGHDDIGPVPGNCMTGHDLCHEGRGGEPERKQGRAGREVDGVRQKPGH